MLVHKAPMFDIYFGNKQDNLDPQYYLTADQDYLTYTLFAKAQKVLQLEQCMFLHQVHSAEGLVITAENAGLLQPFAQQGDFLITDLQNIGLGVVTADCLPIIFYDTRHHAIGIAHAGWRGSVQSIATKTVKSMQKAYNTDITQLQIFFGPSAQVCCYQVSNDFIEHLEPFAYADRVMQQRENGLFFDLPQFNRLQLEAMGIKKESIHLRYNICTICNANFCSARQGDKTRQMTVVSLK